MSTKSIAKFCSGSMVRAVWLAGLMTLLPAIASAQTPDNEEQESPDGAFSRILQAGCQSCGGGLIGAARPDYGYSSGAMDGGCEGGCFPGGGKCAPCCGTNALSRMFCAFHDCLCCPDPCYEGRWIGAANAALFVDGARPITQARLRWDAGYHLQFPDRAEYYWARIGGKGPARPETNVNYHYLSFYSEAATEKFSAFIEMPYWQFNPEQNRGGNGFGNLNIGTKTMFLDCELVQMSFQIVTGIPTGSPGKGVSNGHVSIEPSLIAAIKLYPDTYLQAQIAQWIPIGGTAGFQGGILHYHASLNHVICRPVADTQLVGTLEFNGWTFQSGSYTDPLLGVQSANNYTYFSIGPGVRYIICDKVDIGFGAQFSVTNQHFADTLYRTELRWRF